MAIITRPFWKTNFPQIFRWFQQYFKPKQIELASSSHQATQQPQAAPVKTIQQNLTKNGGNMNLMQVAKFVTELSSKSRTPAIKFLGPRTPKPKFDANKYPIKVQASSSINSVSSAPKISSIGKVGTTPRGSGIEESQLPLRYRRRLIDEEEIKAINNGGAYGGL